MSDVIGVLSEYVANQIAAGEVVRNGASVVKELMENAIDAGSTWVIVRIRGGGIESIQVADDGCGMSHADALTAFSRHATSKIRDVNDIFSIQTYGFRGEALPSVASVAEVELKTRREEDELGTRVEVNGGEPVDHSYVSAAKGTQIVVRNLFYNIPARRKHLKSPDREARYILDEFMRVALCYPKIAFFFYNDEVCLCNLRATNLRQRVVAVMASSGTKGADRGGSLAAAARQRNLVNKCNGVLVDLFAETSIVKVCGYIGKPEAARKNAEQYLFVNGRYFKSPAFRKAIQNAYEKLLPDPNVLPPYFVYLEIDPSKIDVNIHPAKVEVKFEEEQEIWQIINAAVRESLGKHGIVPMIDFETGGDIDIPVFRHSDEFKSPDPDINPEFNPFDESFSFTNAVKGLDETFRESIAGGAAFETARTDASPTAVSGEFYSSNWETDFYGAAGDEFRTEGPPVEGESFSDLIVAAPGEESTVEISSSMQDDGETYRDIDSGGDSGGAFGVVEIESRANETPGLFAGDDTFGGVLSLGGRYAVVSAGGNLLLADLARAMNRIAYERFERQLEADRPLASQKLLFPAAITLVASDLLAVSESLDDFRFMGFDLSLDGDTVTLDGIPADAAGGDPETLFEELLTALKMDELYGYKQSRREKMIMGLAGVCGTGALPAPGEQTESCLRELLACRNRNYTPAGKKILVAIGPDELKKLFN